MKWIIEPPAPRQLVTPLADALATAHAFPFALADILVRRGITTKEEARIFFTPQPDQLADPYEMKDMELAVERLVAARKMGEKVLLFGDYDVDGTTAVTLLSLFFMDWGFDFEYYLPDRYTEGYGISYQGIDYAVEIDASLMVSLDCGIKAVEKIRYAKVKGIDVIVCDHHKPGPELPDAVAILDPNRPDDDYPYKHLTGCGVGFRLIQALQPAFIKAGISPAANPTPEDPFAKYSDLVTLSIACDIVPITGENRTIALAGLEKIRQNPLPGLQAIMDLSQQARSWDISDLVFFLGPIVNSAGRLNHAKEAVEVLLGHHQEVSQKAGALVNSNAERQEIDRQITQEALYSLATDPHEAQLHTTVLFNPEWHKGVIGIVASRLIETHYRPTILLTESEGKLVGSARSVHGFDLYQALDQCTDHLLQFGGHKYAAGLSMQEDQFPAFKQCFEDVVAQSILPEQKIPLLKIEYELSLADIDARFIRLINRMAPFGPGNPRPVFISRNVKVLHTTILKSLHLKLVVEQEGVMMEAIGFSMAKRWYELGQPDSLHIAYQATFNTWKGKTKINLRLKDIKRVGEEIM